MAWGQLSSSAEREGNLHVGQKFRQVRCPTVFDICIEQHSTHENTTQCGKQEGHKPCPHHDCRQSCLHWSVPTGRKGGACIQNRIVCIYVFLHSIFAKHYSSYWRYPLTWERQPS
jgi:hypothetical protein